MGINPLLKHIFLAEDDQDDQRFFVDAVKLVAPHIKVSVSDDGVALMESFNGDNGRLPDLLFLDWNMPRKNGFECLTEIRENIHLQSLPVIIYSTSSSVDLIDRTYKAGANLYIMKPQSFEEIKNIIQKILSMTVEEYLPQPPKTLFVLKEHKSL